MIKAISLTCAAFENPLGLGEDHPHFGWKIQSDGKNILQSCYHLQIASDKNFSEVVWDTGRINSDESVHVRYEGPTLVSCSRYYWHVQVEDQNGDVSSWSDVAFFEMGLLDKTLFSAEFISPIEDSGEKSAGYYLRKNFKVSGEVDRVTAYATALGMYQLHINGQLASDALLTPGWTTYEKRVQVQTYDLTDKVVVGDNCIGSLLGAGWFKGDLAGWMGKRNLYGKRNALYVQLHITYKDGSEEVIITDDSWQSASSPILMSELYHGEHYDARLEITNWCSAKDGSQAWKGVTPIDWNKNTLVMQDGLPVRRQETIKPVKLFTTPKGEQVIDFGQNMSGWVRFKVKGEVGQRVVIHHAEILDKEGNFYTANMRSARNEILYTLGSEEEAVFEPHFTFQGFRYVQIVEYPGDINVENFDAVVIHSDMKPTGDFSCSNVLLNQLFKNIRWGLKGNFVDIPTDCPQRDERLGWTGDAEVFIRAANFIMDTRSFYDKWLRDLAAEQTAEGGIPHVIPNALRGFKREDGTVVETNSACGWADAAVICPWTMYLCYGDKDALARQYPSMEAWISYIKAHSQDGVWWNTGFHFGDWLALDAKEGSYLGATPNDFTATAFYAYSVQLMIKAAHALGKARDVKNYKQLHEKIVDHFQKEYFTVNGRLAIQTQTAHILALMFNLVPEHAISRTVDGLVKMINDNGGHLSTGFLGTPFMCHALSRNGRFDAAFDLLQKEDYPSWLYPVTVGATTIWEHWDGLKPDGSMWSADMNSFNHYAYGAIGDWLVQVAAGLDIDEENVAYKHIQIAPHLASNWQWLKSSYESVYGLLAIEVNKGEDNRAHVKVQVPHNTTATLVLAGNTFEIGSGEHEFDYMV